MEHSRQFQQGSLGMKMGRIFDRRAGRAALVLLAAGLLGGCATQQSHDQLMDSNRSLTEQNQDLRRQNQELTNEVGLLQRQLTASEAATGELNRVNSDLRNRLAQLGVNLNDLQNRVAGLQFAELDPETDRALQALAAQYPDIIRYDAQRGMLRFASDLTFASGSDQVQDNARRSLEALGRILTSGAAAQYEVMVMGHTDRQPISGGTAPRHPTNMHLSAHRAISVRNVLASMGVPSDKMFVAGWGEFRPIAPDGPRGNTPQNRRVEIYLTRATRPASGSEGENLPSSSTSQPQRELPPSRQPDMTK
jgi:chemotaxis protein MotB